ncbi:MAG: ATP-binding protein [Myxococcales bacterium]|nr:ATP-binding protein [Myxococcales bacterium]
MKRLGFWDKLVLATFFPLWLACLSLHVKEVVSTGLAGVPVYASPAAGSPYPIVGGYWLERGTGSGALEVGDRMIRVGDSDLSGVGYLRFEAIALDEAAGADSVSLVIERDGVRSEVALEILPHAFPWFRAIPIVTLAIVCLLILLRAPSPESRRLFAAAMSICILQTTFLGGPRWQGYASFFLFNALGGVALFLVVRWALRFPPELAREQRLSPNWAALGLLWYVPRLMFVFGGPIPTHWILQATLAIDALFLLGVLLIGTRHYRASGPVGRRRFKWLLLGAWLGVLPLALVVLVGAIVPEGIEFSFPFELGVLMTTAVSIGLLIAIVRFNLFDVDRIVSAAASWSLVLVVLVIALIAVLLPVARVLAAWSGLDPLWVQSGLGLVSAGVAIPVSARVRPWLDRYIFPERAAFRRGSDVLLRALRDGNGPEDVVMTLGERVHALLRPSFTVVFAHVGSRYEPIAAWGDPEPAAIDAGTSIPLVLREYGLPTLVQAGSARHEGADFDRADRESLAALDCRMLIPVIEDETLAAIIALGEKRSRDIYTQTELSRLAAIADRASRTVQRIRDAQRLREGHAQLESMRAQKEDADASNLAKSRFLASASHDLRQPLHALGLFSEALGQRASEPAILPLVGRIQDTVSNLQEMMDGILDLSRLEAGRVEARIEDFALGPLLVRIEEEFGVQAESAGLRLRARATDAVVRSDRLLLTRILQNLVVNALRYTDRGGVLVGCRSRGDVVRIEVWDTGRGIPEEQLAGVFEEFRQLERDAREEGPGLGLGLSIVDRLARLLGHEVEVKSTLGRGTRFSIRVPRGERVAAAMPQPAIAADRIAGSVVLIVDDETAILEGMRELVEPWGARVLAAASRDEALARAREMRPDVIVSDFRLGTEALGPAVISAVREEVGSPVPALIVTGDTSRVSLAELRGTGHPFLHKPVKPARLRAALAQLLRG